VIRKTQNAKNDSNLTELPGYRKLLTWQVADELANQIYSFTCSFPRHELYGLTSQLRRAALSVPLNIIEGYARNSRKEFRQFLKISLGSLAETTYLMEFALKQKYFQPKDYRPLLKLKNRCGQLLWKLYQSQK